MFVSSASSDSKCQITTLVAASAAGNVIPPMHLYPGKMAPHINPTEGHINPMEGCVNGAYYGRSDKGWMTTELFCGWLANHSAKQIPSEHPVLLLVEFCAQNGLLLYCLPHHTCYNRWTLDSLKNWQKEVGEYKLKNIGASMTRDTFACVQGCIDKYSEDANNCQFI